MTEVVGTTGDVRRAKLQSYNHINKSTPNFLQTRRPSCRPTNSIRALKENLYLTL